MDGNYSDHPCVVMVGNLNEGYKCYGPFNNFDEAAEWSDKNTTFNSWVMSLLPLDKTTNTDEG